MHESMHGSQETHPLFLHTRALSNIAQVDVTSASNGEQAAKSDKGTEEIRGKRKVSTHTGVREGVHTPLRRAKHVQLHTHCS